MGLWKEVTQVSLLPSDVPLLESRFVAPESPVGLHNELHFPPLDLVKLQLLAICHLFFFLEKELTTLFYQSVRGN